MPNEKNGEHVDESMKHLKTIMKFDKDLAENMEGMKNDELKQRVLQSAQNLIENERQQEEDDKLAKAKVKYDDLRFPYTDAKKFQTAIVRYGMLLLEQRGVPFSNKE